MAQAVDHYEYEKGPHLSGSHRPGPDHPDRVEPERRSDYSTGFSSGWELTRRENVFYLKPKNVDVDTNMMVRAETHSYLRTEGGGHRLAS